MDHHAGWATTPPLRIPDRRASLGDVGAAPPYTWPERVGPLSVGTEAEGEDSSDQGSLSMHSCAEDPDDFLPSPHSVENLGHAQDTTLDDQQDDETTTIAHGYAFPHPDSSYTASTSTPPPQNDINPSGMISGRGPYSHETRTRYARHYSTPTSPSASYGMLSSTIRSSEGTTSPTMYHHRPMSQPAGIGQMTWRQNKHGFVYHDASDDLVNDARRGQPPPMASTATFLPEGQPPQFRSTAQLTSHEQVQNQNQNQNADQPTSAVVAPAPGRATNFVSLSRRSTIRKSGLLRKTVVSSSITGTFTIDPSLHISPGLLKALETPSALVTGLFPGMQPKGAATAAKQATRNLQLEVENGGIDVDIHLVPPARGATRRMTIGARPATPRAEPVIARPVVAPAPVSNVRMSFERSGMSEESWVRAGNPRPSARSRSIDIQPSTPPPAPPPPPTPAGPTPTLIDLRLKEARGGKSKKVAPKKSKGTEFALVARLHAPHPRPPFHLLASTVDIIPHTPAAQPSTGVPPPDPNASAPPRPRPPRRPAPVPYSRSMSRSPLTLHVPRTFRGPLTVHVGVGDLDTHVCLSRGMRAAAVVLAESAYSRGYFVGKLTEDEGRELGRGLALGLEKQDAAREKGDVEGEGEAEGDVEEEEKTRRSGGGIKLMFLSGAAWYICNFLGRRMHLASVASGAGFLVAVERLT